MITRDFKKLIWFQYKIFVMSAPQVLIRQLTNWNIFVFPLKEVDNIEYTPWHKFVNFYLDFYLTVKRGMNLLGLARLFKANSWDSHFDQSDVLSETVQWWKFNEMNWAGGAK